MAEKIKPCYTYYDKSDGSTTMHFRREDKTPAEIKFWKKFFPNVRIGTLVILTLPYDGTIAQLKSKYPQLDFETEVL